MSSPKPFTLDPDTDLEVNIHDLTGEFKKLSLLLYRYSSVYAECKRRRDIAKAKLKEVRAVVYKRLKLDVTTKHSEKSLEAELDADKDVWDATLKLADAEHAVSTWDGAVESMKAKKDMIIQLGSDRRKEVK